MRKGKGTLGKGTTSLEINALAGFNWEALFVDTLLLWQYSFFPG